MKTFNHLAGRVYFTLCFAALLSAPAFAYLDPGTLTYVISMIAGLFIAGGAALAIFRRKIKLFFQNLGKKKDAGSPPAAAGTPDDFNPMDDVVDPMAQEDDQ